MTALAAQLPNLLCVARIALVWPIINGLLAGRFAQALIMLVIAGITDWADGFLARTCNWRTRVGGLLDPLADKILLVGTFLTLTALGLVPLWLTAVVLVRDLVIVTGGLTYQFTVGPVEPEPSKVSRFNTGAQLGFLGLVLAEQVLAGMPLLLLDFAGAAVLVTSSVSGLDYVMRWSRKAVTASP